MSDEIIFFKRSLDLSGKDAVRTFRMFLTTHLEDPEDAWAYALNDRQFKMAWNNAMLMDEDTASWVSRNNTPVAFIVSGWSPQWVRALMKGLKPELRFDIIDDVLEDKA